MLFAYQVIAVIFFICSFLGDYKRYSDSPSEIAGNLIGSAFAGGLWPLTVLIHIFASQTAIAKISTKERTSSDPFVK